MIKRKGQIVPKWLVKSLEKKAQHVIKFGCDVEICRGSKVVRALSEGCVFHVKHVNHVLKKKNQVRVKGFDIRIVSIVGYNL